MNSVKKLSAALLVCILAVLCLVSCNEKEVKPEILEAKTIEIASASELKDASRYVGVSYKNYTLRLTADIDLTDLVDAQSEVVSWEPIGNTLTNAFMGTFDGNGHSVKGLTVTGWDYDGTPKYIAKRILGWTESGQTVYQSKEVVSLQPDADGKVSDATIIYEGDNDDLNYVNMEENGKMETLTSFGSVGLFGYTKKATIQDVTFIDADISFYGSGKYVYAGIVSGFDVASSFENVTVLDSAIKISSLYEKEVLYSTKTGTPHEFSIKNVTTQYVGGLVGYAKSCSETQNDGSYTVTSTSLKDVSVQNIVLDNHNYIAYFDAGLEIEHDDPSDESTSYLHTDLVSGEKGSYQVLSVYNTSFKKDWYPEYAFVGGVAGYMEGSELENVTVDGVNKTNDIANTAHSLMARCLNASGIVASLRNGKITDVSAQNVYLSAVNWRNRSNRTNKTGGLVTDKCMIAGAFAVVEGGLYSDISVEKFFAEAVVGENVKSIGMGGFAAYCFDDAVMKNISVKDAYFFSNYGAKGEIATLFGGAIAVMRDSSVQEISVENVDFEIDTGSTHEEEDYIFTNNLIAQVYGNSVFKNAEAKNCNIMTSRIDKQEYTVVQPKTIANNNYVNEDGENSIRLYYAQQDKVAGVYVTVYGNLIKIDKDGNYLYDETVYIPFGNQESYTGTLAHPDDFIGGDLPTTGEYFYKAEGGWNRIKDDTADIHKSYNAEKIYAYSKETYRVGLQASMIGKEIPAGTYYEYNKEVGSYVLTQDKNFVGGKDYYLDVDESKISSYVLEISVYGESGDLLVVRKGKTEDDDVLAQAVYAIEKNVYDLYEKTYTDAYGTEGNLCEAEICLDSFFTVGQGFIADKNGFLITSADGKANRNFASYVLIDGRPTIDASGILYK